LDESNDKLSGQEKLDIVVEAGLQLIPTIGSSLATAYYGTKQAKQFKRLENFYKDLSQTVEALKLQLPLLNEKDEEEIISLIEKINEQIEREISDSKRNCFKYFLLNSLGRNEEFSFDTKRFFLDSLSACNELDLEILAHLYNSTPTLKIVGSISRSGVEQYAIVGSISRLKSFGFAFTATGSMSVGDNSDNTLRESVGITTFGKQFVEYTLKIEVIEA